MSTTYPKSGKCSKMSKGTGDTVTTKPLPFPPGTRGAGEQPVDFKKGRK